ncbi:hypothetical protein BpHYR1_013329 [Brachionus plicatilis]|uniref:Uncharacterized protein n=1 Tax=Brachionus plicatilis TaxID=10195 RepID=A0A3M7QF03_BRAPC|nr:hypothetical protein BpHYR1_013329 [Brachionus plicatilis]
MPKRVLKLPVSLEIDKLKNLYNPIIEKIPNASEEQKRNFNDLIIPALADFELLAIFPICRDLSVILMIAKEKNPFPANKNLCNI